MKKQFNGAKNALAEHGANFMVATTLALGIAAFAVEFFSGLMPLIMGFNAWPIWAHGYLLTAGLFALACFVPLILAAFSSTVRNVFAHVMGNNTPLAPGVDYGVVAGVVGFNIVMLMLWLGSIALSAIWTRRWVQQPGSTTYLEDGTYAGMNPVDALTGLPTEPRNAVLLMAIVFYTLFVSILHFVGGVITTFYYMFSIPPQKFLANMNDWTKGVQA